VSGGGEELKFLTKFFYGSLDGLHHSRCDQCNEKGGLWRGRVGAPELRGKRFHDWRPEQEHACTWDGEDPKDPVEHVVVIHPELLRHKTLMADCVIHEWFHVIDHTERCRDTPGWYLPHSVITRLATAFAKFLAENNLEIVQHKIVKAEPEDV